MECTKNYLYRVLHCRKKWYNGFIKLQNFNLYVESRDKSNRYISSCQWHFQNVQKKIGQENGLFLNMNKSHKSTSLSCNAVHVNPQIIILILREIVCKIPLIYQRTPILKGICLENPIFEVKWICKEKWTVILSSSGVTEGRF